VGSFNIPNVSRSDQDIKSCSGTLKLEGLGPKSNSIISGLRTLYLKEAVTTVSCAKA